MEGLWGTLFAQVGPGGVLVAILGRLYYLFALVDLIGGIVCLAYAQVSSRLVVAGIGFLGQVGMFVVRQFLLPFLGLGWGDENFELLRGLMMLVNLMFGILVVVGLALAFADIQRQLRAAGRSRPRLEEDEDDRPTWQRR